MRYKLQSLWLLLVLVANLGLSSCSQDEDIRSFSPEKKTIQKSNIQAQVKANLVLVKYLELVDETYVLNISAKEAEQLGVPLPLYENALSEIAMTNKLIREAKKEPNTEIELTNPKEALRKD